MKLPIYMTQDQATQYHHETTSQYSEPARKNLILILCTPKVLQFMHSNTFLVEFF